MLKRRYREFFGIILIILSIYFLITIFIYKPANITAELNGTLFLDDIHPGWAWSGYILRSLFGVGSYLFVTALLLSAIYLISSAPIKKYSEKSIILLILTVSASTIITMLFPIIPLLSGGYVGLYLSQFMNSLMGKTFSYIVLSAIIIANWIFLLVFFLSPIHERIDVSSNPRGTIRLFIQRILFKRINPYIPLNTIGSALDGSKRKFPWIIKKRILIYETERREIKTESFHLPVLPNSLQKEIGMIEEQSSAMNSYSSDIDAGKDLFADNEVMLREDEYKIEQFDGTDLLENDYNDENEADEKDDLDEQERETAVIESEDEAQQITTQDLIIDKSFKEISQSSVNDSMRTVNQNEKVFGDIPINQEYIVPYTYLTSSKPLDSESWKKEIHKNSIILKRTLAEFGIDAEVTNVNRGPVITLYEMQIAPGIKLTRIVGLADDIAMATAAQRVRIVAPIPGKSAIGVEIPNRYRETVTLGDIVKSVEFQNFEGNLVVALGKDILGKPVMLDLKRQPHLLIAGATGAGKSVCVNALITSLLYNYDPNHLRFIMIDPKMVELQLYNGLPHLLTPVIVDPHMAPMVLKWTLHEMERRYFLLSEINTRDIDRYNEKVKRKDSGMEKLPYIVVIIDEMADLMMSSKEVEGYITRIAQKARAVGIHLVVATQRPSVDIITGIIKANFPARIAFQVAQKTDSRTIIDQNGAEKLLGRGDMLYQSPTSSFPVRIQGGYISEDEIERITSHLCKLGKPSYIDIEESLYPEDESMEPEDDTDDLFTEALKIIEESKKASASYLQRRLSIGYNRAARIIEQMEEMGYVGPQIGSKPREIYI